MELLGKIWKEKKFWLVEIPILNTMTQGKTQKHALHMANDLIREMVISYFPNKIDDSFVVTINLYDQGIIGVTTTDNHFIYALSLKRQREGSGSTVREVSKRLGSTSPNAYSQYERGGKRMSLEKYDQLLSAVNPIQHAFIGIA